VSVDQNFTVNIIVYRGKIKEWGNQYAESFTKVPDLDFLDVACG